MKKTIYIIAPYPKGKAPSQRFRFEQYLTLLENKGYKIRYCPFLSESTWKILYQEKKYLQKFFGILVAFIRRWLLLFELINAKNIFIHREMAHIGPPIFEFIVAKILRKKYIYDFDDAIWLPNFSNSNAKFQHLKNYKKVNACMKWAHKITAGNEYLRDYALQFNSNVEIIPTTIDMENYHNGKIDYNKEEINIGWTGTHTTLHYLEEIVPDLKKLKENYSFSFIVIANIKPAFEIPNLLFIPWNKKTEIIDLLKIDIGVMPLKDDIWAKGKCGFKALQYMSLGIPTIVSAVGVNSDIINNENNGLLIHSKKDWLINLEKLLTSKDLRKKLGKAGKETIKLKYSVNANNDKYLSLFN